MRLNKAIKMLKDAYITGQTMVWVRKPMAYALYQVWKYFDEYEKPRYQKKETEK